MRVCRTGSLVLMRLTTIRSEVAAQALSSDLHDRVTFADPRSPSCRALPPEPKLLVRTPSSAPIDSITSRASQENGRRVLRCRVLDILRVLERMPPAQGREAGKVPVRGHPRTTRLQR